jgi:hypothetical protein
VATFKVDDTQAPVSKTVLSGCPQAMVVGAAMPDDIGHLACLGDIAVTGAAISDYSRYSAHISSPAMI